MSSYTKKIVFALCCVVKIVLAGSWAYGQEVTIALGPGEIGQNQAWTITVTVANERLKSYNGFPDIPGFRKRGTSSSSNTQIINGRISSSQSITMTYAPDRQGKTSVPAFTMTINGKKVNAKGKVVTVGPPVQRRRSRDPFRSLFDHDPFDDSRSRGSTEFVEIDEDAFLALTTNKTDVYVGEGVTTTLSFYVAERNRAPLQFHELGKQLSGILKELRPENCWEENFNIENITGEAVNIRNKSYTQYKIYQAVFYPLNAEDITFPSLGLKMIKYKVAKNPSFFGRNRQEDFKTFYSKPKTVSVKELPPHPLKDQVAVGDYRLDEQVNTRNFETGQSFTYDFNIYGEGNISAVNKPQIPPGEAFDFYDPNVVQNIKRHRGHVTGSKAFHYFGIPKEPGTYRLGDYFRWVFFNPKSGQYDTLQSAKTITVTGESKKNEAIQSNDFGSFYDKIDFTDNTLVSTDRFGQIKLVVNLLILVMLASSAVLFFKK